MLNVFQKIVNASKFLKKPHLFKLRKYGFELEKYEAFMSPFFQNFNIETILDIGANTGQLAITLRCAFPNAQIYSFEPLPNCYAQLVENMRRFKNFQAFNIALGETSGTIEFEENEFSASSSILKISDEHTKNFPFTEKTKKVQVDVKTLDSLSENVALNGNMLVKMDVQGYESFVIAGGKQVLKKAKIIITETSVETLYENQKLFSDIYQQLTNLGFEYKGSFDQLKSPIDGRILQQDALFVKK